eukprot:comp14918_c0_seq1/m.11476 comp14918_c0_seq1/g.11476  ORF comp14918_c0_seq1/g.11476 comp14918_c0_seq1/m.11476 type:complete len:151 (-) comp14918_c0_seq1:402-854(-)
MREGLVLALSAGLCAALASVAGKMSFDDHYLHNMFSYVMGMMLEADVRDDKQILHWVTRIGRVCSFGLMFGFNALMWTLFTKSLSKCSSTLEATVTNSAANFFFTALCGMVLFQETLPLLWWVGGSFVVVGLLLVNRGAQALENETKKTN